MFYYGWENKKTFELYTTLCEAFEEAPVDCRDLKDYLNNNSKNKWRLAIVRSNCNKLVRAGVAEFKNDIVEILECGLSEQDLYTRLLRRSNLDKESACRFQISLYLVSSVHEIYNNFLYEPVNLDELKKLKGINSKSIENLLKDDILKEDKEGRFFLDEEKVEKIRNKPIYASLFDSEKDIRRRMKNK
ncbi:MAG TPA: hypothetical protein ENN30_02465 [Candidatus Woesearchaeota archaeon]|nr:hypothetical protein [Candidatus Woesearchaeota archaeon]